MITNLTRTTSTDALAALIAAEDEYQAAREALERAEERRYAAVWGAVEVCEDMTALRAISPKTITRGTIKAAARRFAGAARAWLQPELW